MLQCCTRDDLWEIAARAREHVRVAAPHQQARESYRLMGVMAQAILEMLDGPPVDPKNVARMCISVVAGCTREDDGPKDSAYESLLNQLVEKLKPVLR